MTARHIAHDCGVEIGSGWSKENASLVCYILGLTQINPLEYGLPFEMFLNMNNPTPNIVLELSRDGPNAVRDGLAKMYGTDHVAHLMNRLAVSPRQLAKDVCEVCGISIKRCAKFIEKLSRDSRVLTAKRSLKWDGQGYAELLKAAQSKKPLLSYLAKGVLGTYGAVKAHSVHSCGIVVCPGGLTNVTPLIDPKFSEKDNPEHVKVTMLGQYELEGTGAYIVDVIQLAALDIRRKCIEIIKKRTGKGLYVDSIPLDDEKTMKLFRSGKTEEFPYFGSAKLREMLKAGQPRTFSDLMVIKAIGDDALADKRRKVLDRMAGVEPVRPEVKELHPFLADSYGVPVFSEQYVHFMTDFCNMSTGQAVAVIESLKSKDEDRKSCAWMDFYGTNNRHKDMGDDEYEALIERMWDKLEKDIDCLVDKSHIISRVLIDYQLGYLKANYPGAFKSAVKQCRKKSLSETVGKKS